VLKPGHKKREKKSRGKIGIPRGQAKKTRGGGNKKREKRRGLGGGKN